MLGTFLCEPITAIVRSPCREFKNGMLSVNAILSFSIVCHHQDPKPNDAWLASILICIIILLGCSVKPEWQFR